MFFTNSSPGKNNKTKTIDALVPMIDLFAVLAIVFMIYSSDEIIAQQEKSQETIEEIASEYKKLQEEVAAAEKARQERRDMLAQNAVKSLDEIEQERELKARQLVQEFTEMLQAQQNQAAVEYEMLVAKFELEQELEVERQKAELEEEKRQQLEQEQAELQRQKEIEVSEVKQQMEQQRTEELERQRVELEVQKQAAAQAAAEAAAEVARQQAAAEAQQALAAQQAQLEAQQAQQLALQQAQLEAEQAEEMQRLQALARQAAQTAAQSAAESKAREVLQTARQQVEAEVAAEHQQALQQQMAQLEAQKQAELQPFLEAEQQKQAAQQAREQIVDRLTENFKDSEEGDVEIDARTGRVRINFQESYFVRGSAELSDSMKDLLRVMIPKYAKSIYENTEAAKQVESLKISGLTSPIFRGRYFDIDDTSPEGEEAREYNLKLSNDRALAMHEFIFNIEEMGDYPYRAQLKADLGIEALGYRTAAPVPEHLVGELATCIEYDCKKEQASILEFRLYSEENTTVRAQN